MHFLCYFFYFHHCMFYYYQPIQLVSCSSNFSFDSLYLYTHTNHHWSMIMINVASCLEGSLFGHLYSFGVVLSCKVLTWMETMTTHVLCDMVTLKAALDELSNQGKRNSTLWLYKTNAEFVTRHFEIWEGCIAAQDTIETNKKPSHILEL